MPGPSVELIRGVPPFAEALLCKDGRRLLLVVAGVGVAEERPVIEIDLHVSRCETRALQLPDQFAFVRRIGAQVFDRAGGAIGAVVAVEPNPASDLLVVAIDDKEHLVPMVFVVTSRTWYVVCEGSIPMPSSVSVRTLVREAIPNQLSVMRKLEPSGKSSAKHTPENRLGRAAASAAFNAAS